MLARLRLDGELSYSPSLISMCEPVTFLYLPETTVICNGERAILKCGKQFQFLRVRSHGFIKKVWCFSM